MRHVRPLSERIIDNLPGRSSVWIVIWALVPWVNALVNLSLDEDDRSAVWDQGTAAVVLSYAALSLAMVVTMWGAAKLARRLEALGGADVLAGDQSLRARYANAVPIVGACLMAVAFGGTTLIEDQGIWPAVIRAATWFVLGIAIWSFLWTYGVLQVALDRFGRAHLRTNVGNMAPDLGLRPFGDIAFLGLWLLLAWLVPVVWTGLPDAVGFAIGMTALAIGLALFFLSLYRLHQRMVEVKNEELKTARDLYAAAYQPLRDNPTTDVLEQQRNLLGAADGLEKRAQAIQEWPIDDGTMARVVTITTSVVAVTIARLLLDPFGL